MNSFSNNIVIQQLIELGLTNHEALIYLAVLKHGESSAGVVLDEVKLHREQVYRALKRLTDEGYLTQFEKRKRQYYSAIDPSTLVHRAKSKVAQAEALQPYLLELYRKKPQVITVTEGEEALKIQIEDMISTMENGDEYLILGGVGNQYYDIVAKYMHLYEKRLINKNIHGRILAYEGSQYPGKTAFSENLSIKKIKRPAQFPALTMIYGNKVAIDIMDPQNIAVITIENETIADSYRQTFETLWR